MPKRKFNTVETNIRGNILTVWCDGRSYDPVEESYRPVYSYSIVTKNWRYDANDIMGKANDVPCLDTASVAVLTMLMACAASEDDEESFDSFPPHVRELAVDEFDTLQELCMQIATKKK